MSKCRQANLHSDSLAENCKKASDKYPGYVGGIEERMSGASNEKQTAVGIQAIRLRPGWITGDVEQASIWTTTHHLEAAAEASAEISVSVQVGRCMS